MGRKGHPLYAEQWPNRKCFQVGVMAGRRHTFPAIAEALADGTTADDAKRMANHWGFVPRARRKGEVIVEVPLPGKLRTKLAHEAKRRGLEMDQLIADVMHAIAADELWAAILDG